MPAFNPSWRGDAAKTPDGDMIAEICGRIMERENLIDILREPQYPSLKTFYKWLAMEPAWKQMYMDALEVKMHGYVEETVIIADASNERMVKKAELQVRARQWAAERLGRRYFGDPKQVTVNGNVQITHNSIHQLLTDGTQNQHLGIDVAQTEDKGGEVIDAEAQGREDQVERGEETAGDRKSGGSPGGNRDLQPQFAGYAAVGEADLPEQGDDRDQGRPEKDGRRAGRNRAPFGEGGQALDLLTTKETPES